MSQPTPVHCWCRTLRDAGAPTDSKCGPCLARENAALKAKLEGLAAPSSAPLEQGDGRCWEHRPGRGNARRCIREVGHEGQHIDFESQYWTTGADAAAPPSESGWQAIETAPKDGTSVLVHDCGAVFISTWVDDDVQSGWFDHGFVLPPPTHWMPLPAPPDVSVKEKTTKNE